MITITFGHHIWAPNSEATFPILISTDSAEEISAVDLYLEVEDGNTGPLPFATEVDLLNGTIFGAVSSSQAPYGDPWDVENGNSTGYKPAFAVFANATTGPNADVLASGVLAYVTWSNVGVPAGVYNVGFTSADLGITLVGKTTGLLEPGVDYFVEPGTLGLPEPSSVVLAIFGALGLMGWRMRRKR